MDRILVRELTARCIIGLRPEERAAKQEVVVSLALRVDLARAAASDRFEDTVDYRAIKKRVLAVVEESEFHLLEALAEAIARACLEAPGIAAVRVTVDKPGALRFARSVAVDIVRRRAARAFVGVGSNLEPEANIRAAMRLLADRVRVASVSTFYRTPAEGRPEQPAYFDGVVAIDTDLSPSALEGLLHRIERRLGRRRTEDKLASRVIDLDLLLYGSLEAPSHPGEVERRAYVAVPLAEIAPDLTIPGAGASAREVAARFDASLLQPVAGLAEVLRSEARCR